MTNFRKDIINLAKVVFLAAILSVGISLVFAAWQDPNADPPGNNAEAPVNVSDAHQIKAGNITLNTIGRAIGLLIDKGRVEVGDNTNDPINQRKQKLVAFGLVGADEYCDRNFSNCTVAGDLGGGGGTDELVKADADDPTAGFLDAKVRWSIVVNAANNVLQLFNDQNTPGNNKCYGTSGTGNKGWFTCDIDNNVGGGGGADEKVKANASDPTSTFLRPALEPGRGINLSVTSDNERVRIDGGYDRIQDEGNARAQQSTLNFTGAGVTCSNDATNNRTKCDIPGGGGGGKSNLYVKRVVGQFVKVFCNSGDIATGGGADNGVTGGKDMYYSYPIDAAGNMAADGGQAAGWHCGTELTGRCYVICMR